jgi:hypothetical protein
MGLNSSRRDVPDRKRLGAPGAFLNFLDFFAAFGTAALLLSPGDSFDALR